MKFVFSIMSLAFLFSLGLNFGAPTFSHAQQRQQMPQQHPGGPQGGYGQPAYPGGYGRPIYGGGYGNNYYRHYYPGRVYYYVGPVRPYPPYYYGNGYVNGYPYVGGQIYYSNPCGALALAYYGCTIGGAETITYVNSCNQTMTNFTGGVCGVPQMVPQQRMQVKPQPEPPIEQQEVPAPHGS